jgi:hypothetical protein
MSATLPTALRDVHPTFQGDLPIRPEETAEVHKGEKEKVAQLFSQDQLEAIAGALGDTETGLKGTEIAMLIATCQMTDPGEMTKRHRIYNAFAASQNSRQDRTRILGFIRHAMSPARFSREPHRYEPMRASLNQALAFAGLVVSEAGKIETVEQATTLPEAQRRAKELRTDLETRGVHPDARRSPGRAALLPRGAASRRLFPRGSGGGEKRRRQDAGQDGPVR